MGRGEDILDKRLRICVIQRKPGALDLNHDPVPLEECVIIRMQIDQPRCDGSGRNSGRVIETFVEAAAQYLSGDHQLVTGQLLVCELSVAVCSSEAVALRHPIMPVGNGFSGRGVGVNSRQLR